MPASALSARIRELRGAPFPGGIADRVLRNSFNTTWDGRTAEIDARRADLQHELAAGAQAQDPAVVDISAGVGAGLVSSLAPAGEIVRRIAAEAEQLLRQRPATLVR